MPSFQISLVICVSWAAQVPTFKFLGCLLVPKTVCTDFMPPIIRERLINFLTTFTVISIWWVVCVGRFIFSVDLKHHNYLGMHHQLPVLKETSTMSHVSNYFWNWSVLDDMCTQFQSSNSSESTLRICCSNSQCVSQWGPNVFNTTSKWSLHSSSIAICPLLISPLQAPHPNLRMTWKSYRPIGCLIEHVAWLDLS